MKAKSVFKIIGLSFGILLLVVIGYVAYVFLSYKRIEDNQKLAVSDKNQPTTTGVLLNTDYSVLTYNIGFGAYSADYSFFMDGGKYSRAYSKKAVLDNINGSIQTMKEEQADFTLLQEVDVKSTRSYKVNQYDMICDAFDSYSSVFAVNYDSAYLMYPILEPHGKSKSGLATISSHEIVSSIRRSLPIDTSVYKLIDLDRCYTRSDIAVENGKYLALYNVHLSAYTKDESIVENQIKMLCEDIKKDYDAGNYIICGGDFNQDLLGNSPAIFKTPEIEENWAKDFPKNFLPSGIKVAYELLSEEEIKALTPSCRNADIPYDEKVSFVTMVDGFLISDNVEMIEIHVVDNGFLYSDHNPVQMSFRLK